MVPAWHRGGVVRAVVTGGVGFIGSNLVDRLLAAGHDVTVVDDLSRSSAKGNLDWLQARHGPLTLIRGDVGDRRVVEQSLAGAERVYHLAGQVAVTKSIVDPRGDFHANALGTLNVLEAARLVGDDPIVVYASTNKVYGGLVDGELVEQATRWLDSTWPLGVSETAPVDPHSPYGCSKAAGDQYARDYHRVYGLRTVVMRQSCIIGPRQIGIEDQGWIAWLIIAALTGHPITVYGDGKQVRDVLAVDDLLDAYDAVVDRIDATAGEVFNVGGGPANTISVWHEFGPLLEALVGHDIAVQWGAARAGDQRCYVSDISKLADVVGWRPKIDVRQAITLLHDWLRAELAATIGPAPR